MQDLSALKSGDVVRHVESGNLAVVVVPWDGQQAIAVRVQEASVFNPVFLSVSSEWEAIGYFPGNPPQVAPPEQSAPLTQEDLDWATNEWATNEIDGHAQQQLLAHLKTLCETVQMLHDRIGQRDRLIGRLEEFIRQYVSFNRERLEEMLRAIANLYGDKDAQ